MTQKRNGYVVSPVVRSIAEHYIHPDSSDRWEDSPVTFEKWVKNCLIDYANQSVQPFVRSLPFIRLPSIGSLTEDQALTLNFSENVKRFLQTRRILRVVVRRLGASKGSIIPMTSSEAIRRTGQIEVQAGFEVNIRMGAVEVMLTTLCHEIGHTFFYDISKDPPECFISDAILSNKEHYRRFEGLAFDIGREILLPRESFSKYVKDRCSHPSIPHFLMMKSELKVSIEALSQRLLKDLRLWKCYLFWGRMLDRDMIILGRRLKGPHIIIGKRGKRKNGFFPFSLESELLNYDSILRKTLIEQLSKERLEQTKVILHKRTYSFETKPYESPKGEKWFLALLQRTTSEDIK